mmetsp:Transcript_150381/g.262780  ORF Transcript_150381/g.262780 Transcript_150381/m.262780 type:complete len:85 (-) Transcript_150381:545-799(-)
MSVLQQALIYEVAVCIDNPVNRNSKWTRNHCEQHLVEASGMRTIADGNAIEQANQTSRRHASPVPSGPTGPYLFKSTTVSRSKP